MTKTLIWGFALLVSQPLMAAEIECTSEPREMWMKPDEMKHKAEEMGYKIKKFTTKEKCFEIQGEKDGKKVTDYFNPVDGTLMKGK